MEPIGFVLKPQLMQLLFLQTGLYIYIYMLELLDSALVVSLATLNPAFAGKPRTKATSSLGPSWFVELSATQQPVPNQFGNLVRTYYILIYIYIYKAFLVTSRLIIEIRAKLLNSPTNVSTPE